MDCRWKMQNNSSNSGRKIIFIRLSATSLISRQRATPKILALISHTTQYHRLRGLKSLLKSEHVLLHHGETSCQQYTFLSTTFGDVEGQCFVSRLRLTERNQSHHILDNLPVSDVTPCIISSVSQCGLNVMSLSGFCRCAR